MRDAARRSTSATATFERLRVRVDVEDNEQLVAPAVAAFINGGDLGAVDEP